ncbi:MAG: hypothetical protein ACE145_16125 [Terriglobia bacterium]
MADLRDHTRGIPTYLGGTLLPLVRYAEAAQVKKTLELAGKLTQFLLEPDSAWIPDGYAKGVTPAEHRKPAAVPTYSVYHDREQLRKASAPMIPVERCFADSRTLCW